MVRLLCKHASRKHARFVSTQNMVSKKHKMYGLAIFPEQISLILSDLHHKHIMKLRFRVCLEGESGKSAVRSTHCMVKGVFLCSIKLFADTTFLYAGSNSLQENSKMVRL